MKRVGILAVAALAIVVAGGIVLGLNAADEKVAPMTPAPVTGAPADHGYHQHAAPQAPANPDFALEQKGDIVWGDTNAKVTLTEYVSLSCSHCADFTMNTLPTLEKNYVDTGKVKVIFRDFPLNAPALRASQLVRCTEKAQQKKLINTLFRTQNKWGFDKDYLLHLQQLALLFGMDKPSFEKCVNDKAGEEAMIKSRQDGTKELAVNATPSIYINGERYMQRPDVATLSAALDKVLSGKKLADETPEEKK